MNRIEHKLSCLQKLFLNKPQMRLLIVFLICYPSILLWGQSTVDKKLTLQKLRTYCQACHGVDNLRFIKSDSDDELWQTIFSEKSPKTGKLWVERILAVLDWPNNTPPPFNEPLDSQSDWMPKGFKRIQLSQDFVDEIPVREIIVETLKSGP